MSVSFPSVIEENYRITSADTDFTRRLKISALVNMLIQIAWHHAEILGFGVEFLNRNGLAWVLSRMHMKTGDLPSWNEEMTITTWPKGINRLFYLRDMLVTDASGNIIAETTTEWLMIDMKTKRPKLFDPENNIFQQNLDRHAISSSVPVLLAELKDHEKFEFIVRYSDIDLNQHLTTTRYIDWMFDTLNTHFLSENNSRELVINFLHEIPEKQIVLVKRNALTAQHQLYFEFTDPDEKKIFFRGSLQF